MSNQSHSLGTKAASLLFALLIVSSGLVAFIQLAPATNPVQNAEAASGDYVYTVSNDNTVKKVDKTDASVVWTYSGHSSSLTDVAVDDGYVYTAAADGTARKLDGGDGSLVWNKSVLSSATKVEVGSNYVYVGSDDNTNYRVEAIDKADKSTAWTKSFSDDITGLDTTRDQVFVSSGTTLTNVNKDDQSEKWSVDLGTSVEGVATDSDYAYVGGGDGRLYKFDRVDGSTVWKYNAGTEVYDPIVDKNYVYISTGAGIDKVNISDGSQVWSVTPHSNDVTSLSNDKSGYVYTASIDDTSKKLDKSDGSTVWTFTGHTGYVNSVAAEGQPNVYSEPIKVTVQNQNGAVVEGADVTVTAFTGDTVTVDGETIDTSTESGVDKAVDRFTDPTPSNYDPNTDANAVRNKLSDSETDYTLVHGEEQVSGEESFRQFLGSAGLLSDNADLSHATQTADDETVIITRWDASNDAIVEGSYDSQQAGSTEGGQVIVQRLSPGGEAISKQVVELDKTNSGGTLDPTTAQYAAVELTAGFYRIQPADSNGNAVGAPAIHQHGGLDEIAFALPTGLQGTDGQKTDRANEIANNDGITVKTAVTDSNGQAEIEVPSGTTRVTLEAFKSPDGVTVQSAGDLQNLNVSDVNGSIYVPSEPKTLTPPDSDATLTVREVELNPFQTDIKALEERLDRLQDLLEDKDQRIQTLLDQNQLSQEELDKLEEDLKNSIEENSGLEQRYEELKESSDSQSERIEKLLQTIEQQRDTLDAIQEDINTNVDEGQDGQQLVDATIPFADEQLSNGFTSLDEDDVTVIAHYADGTQTRVADEYVSVDGNAVQITDYPLNGKNSVTFATSVVTEDNTGQERVIVDNPAVAGEPPALDSVNINTLGPEAGQEVTLSVGSDAANFRQLSDVTVTAPDASTVNPTLSNGEANFTPSQTGVYRAELVVEDTNGNQYVEVVKFNTGDTDLPRKPSIRIESGNLGQYAVVSDGATNADVEQKAGGNLRVAAQVSDDVNAPVHVYAADDVTASSDINVQLQRDDKTAVNQRVPVVLHTAKLSDDAVIRHGDEDGEVIGDTSYGTVSDKTSPDGVQHTVIKTYTGPNGKLDVYVENSPGIFERVEYRADKFIAKNVGDVPVIGSVADTGVSMPVISL